MTLSFSQHLNGKPTYFPEKIIAGLDIVDVQKFVLFGILNQGTRPSDAAYEAGSCNPYFPHVPKLHTIREDKADRWKPGMDIHMVINNRTPNRYQFVPVVKCTAVQEIKIKWGIHLYDRVCAVFIDGKILGTEEMTKLALNDGFDSLDDFVTYFNTGFTGKIIHWTHLRY